MQAVAPSVSKMPPLREAQRAVTRSRICDAAREVFCVRGFAAATIEEIAETAGIGRSTLYTHFQHKDEILAVIAADYATAFVDVISRIPIIKPTRSEIDAWLQEVVSFVERERTPTILLANSGTYSEIPPAVHELGATLLRAYAARLPAFSQAIEPGPKQGLAFARAAVVLRELGWAALQFNYHKGQGLGRDLLVVAGELFERFVNQQDD